VKVNSGIQNYESKRSEILVSKGS